MTTLGWVLAAFPVVIAIYAYIGYPLALWVASRFSKGEIREHHAPTSLPTVSVVIPAYNEETQIGGALDAVLAQDYPANRLQILVVSDASTDATDKIVGEYSTRGVELVRMPERSGKTKAENVACGRLLGEIVLNTDASVRLHVSAIRELVARMTDPTVGVTSSRDVSVSTLDAGANVTEAGYVNYEMRVRALETRTGGIVGASGSCYAIRAELHRIPVRDDLSRDFGAPLTACLHGFRSMSVDSAICFVPRTSSLQREYWRKVRTISRGMDTLYHYRGLLDPTRHGTFAWKLFSHKVCRWLLPVSAIPGIAGLALLAPAHIWARVALLVVAVVAALALAGTLWPSKRPMPSLVSLVAFGTAANVAVLNGFWRVAVGRHDHIWEPTRRSA